MSAASAEAILMIIATNTVLICPPSSISSASEMSLARGFICAVGATPEIVPCFRTRFPVVKSTWLRDQSGRGAPTCCLTLHPFSSRSLPSLARSWLAITPPPFPPPCAPPPFTWAGTAPTPLAPSSCSSLSLFFCSSAPGDRRPSSTGALRLCLAIVK